MIIVLRNALKIVQILIRSAQKAKIAVKITVQRNVNVKIAKDVFKVVETNGKSSAMTFGFPRQKMSRRQQEMRNK